MIEETSVGSNHSAPPPDQPNKRPNNGVSVKSSAGMTAITDARRPNQYPSAESDACVATLDQYRYIISGFFDGVQEVNVGGYL